MPIRGKLRRFTENNISNSPSEEGVYALYKKGELIYIGKSGSEGGIKSRLQCHKRGDEGSGTKSSTSFQVERSKTPLKRENQLLEQYKQKYGKLPRYNKRIG